MNWRGKERERERAEESDSPVRERRQTFGRRNEKTNRREREREVFAGGSVGSDSSLTLVPLLDVVGPPVPL